MTDVISEEVIIRCDVCRAERDMEDLFTQIVFVDLIGQPRGTVGIKYCTGEQVINRVHPVAFPYLI